MGKIPGKFNLTTQFSEIALFTAGYHNNLLEDELPLGASTGDSYNFVLDKDGKWTTRGGTKYLGSKSTDTGGCTSALKLVRRDGVELPVVFYSTKSMYYHPEALDWHILETGLTSGKIWGGDVLEKVTDNINRLIMCNGYDDYRIWSGITGKTTSSTATEITLTGTDTLAARGFTATGTIVINGVDYAYTGVSNQTFTGVTPDASGVGSDKYIAQKPIAFPSLPKGSIIISHNGRIIMNAKATSALYSGGSFVGSVLNDPEDFTFSVPRVASEGYQMIMSEGGGNIMAMASFEGDVAIFKKSAVNRHTVTLDQNDSPYQQQLLPYDSMATGTVGIVGQKAVCSLANQVFYVSPKRVINSLQRVATIDYPQALPFSDRIQNFADNLTWDADSCSVGYEKYAYFFGKNPGSAIVDSGVRYNQRFDAWDTPIKGLEIAAFFTFYGELCGAVSSSPDVIKLDTGTMDYATDTTVGNPINSKLTLQRLSYGKNSDRVRSQRCFVEGWMSKAGRIDFTINLDEAGKSFKGTLLGTETGYQFEAPNDGSFGEDEFGADTFGGTWEVSDELPSGTGHFRMILTYPRSSSWNSQLVIETSSYMKLIAYGLDVMQTTVAVPSKLKKSMV